jgi:hypothetical protein
MRGPTLFIKAIRRYSQLSDLDLKALIALENIGGSE